MKHIQKPTLDEALAISRLNGNKDFGLFLQLLMRSREHIRSRNDSQSEAVPLRQGQGASQAVTEIIEASATIDEMITELKIKGTAKYS